MSSCLDEARAIVAEELVWDNHACMPLRPGDTAFLPQLADARAAGVDVISLNVGFGPSGPDEHLAMLDSFTAWLEARPADYAIVRTAADIAAARQSGRMGVLFDVEGMAPLDGGRIDLVDTFRRRGVGWMLVAYNRANDCGSGCYDEADGGLTSYGRAVIAEMRRAGMMLCLSHTAPGTAMAAMEAAEMPVIFSHSNAAAVAPHRRNISDALIDACAATGGVVGINGLSDFLGGPATAARLADHVEHVAARVGVDHVALGLDYVFDRQELDEFLATMKATFPHTVSDELTMLHDRDIVHVAAELLVRGFDRTAVAKVLGGNWLRVAQAVWG